MSDPTPAPFDLGPLPRRIPVTAVQVAGLVADQFPQWRDLPVRPVVESGWDNHTFRLGEQLTVRLPSAAEYAEAVDKEHRWLPVLAPRLPLPVPVPVARGRPGAGCPWGWTVQHWLEGEPIGHGSHGDTADPLRLAGDLAGFVVALRGIATDGGPQPGVHNWFRGGPLGTFAGKVDDALEVLADEVDPETIRTVRAVWDQALTARWDGVDRWFHGDLALGNLLLDGGVLVAVIDFGTCGVGDPACDLAPAWTLLSPAGREVFRSRLGVADDEWARGRGWALWKTLVTCAGSVGETGAAAVGARRVLTGILAEAAGAV